MIAAVFDRRGPSHARERLLRLFRSVDEQASFLVERGSSALGSTSSALAKAHGAEDRLTALSFGVVTHLPTLERTSDDVLLRDPISFVAADEDGLLLARGPYGGRSLFWASEDGDRAILACSRLEPIVATLDPSPNLNMERLAALILSATNPDPRATIYKGIFRIRSCEVARFIGGRTSTTTLRPRWPATHLGSAEEVARELLSRILTAVDRSVERFSKVAVMAGGGLDSSGLAAALARREGRVRGFSFDVCAIDYADCGDDRPHLAALADHLRLQPYRLRPAEAASLVLETLVVDAAPVPWPTGPLLMLGARRARRRGAEAALCGWGGDMLFDGDLGQFAARVRAGDWIRATGELAKLQLLWPSSPFRRVRDFLVRPLARDLVPASWRAAIWRLRARRSEEWGWARGELRKLLNTPSKPFGADWREDAATSPEMDEAAEERGQHDISFGIPRLDPYLDADLVEFMTTVPSSMVFHGHRMRGLYRLAMRGVLPESLRMRSDKASFEQAVTELFASVANEPPFKRLLRMEALGDLGLVEPVQYRKALESAVNGNARLGWLGTWPAVAAEAFVQRHPRPLCAGSARFTMSDSHA
jgi:asparagine synthase (glutamine-hydrolysing)